MQIRIKSNVYFLLILPLLITCQFAYSMQSEPSKEVVSEQKVQGKLVWSDLYTSDVATSIEFYRKTFGWSVKEFSKSTGSYHIFYDDTTPVAGVLSRKTQRNKTDKALWIGSFTTNNIQSAVSNASKMQAKVILAPHDFEFYGKRALIADPQGGIIALLEEKPHNSKDIKLSDKWQWAQLFSINTSKAAQFYQHSLGLTTESVDINKKSFYLSDQGKITASIVSMPTSFEQRDRWVNFITVKKLNASLDKAQAHGGEIIYQSGANQLAIIADPNGALLGLTEQESE